MAVTTHLMGWPLGVLLPLLLALRLRFVMWLEAFSVRGGDGPCDVDPALVGQGNSQRNILDGVRVVVDREEQVEVER